MSPTSCACTISSAGWRMSASCSASIGRISRSAKSCASARSSFCSSLSPKETLTAALSSIATVKALHMYLID